MKLAFITAGFALAFSASGAFAEMVETVDGANGKVVADAKTGMTLYTFKKDADGKSSCYDACATNWPPFMADEEDESKETADLKVIERTDGTYQWAMKGMPLYFFSGDKAKGDANGDGVKGVWDAVHPG
jgi:predicted lipoprotein with Yx(FWY)xxD motif